MTIEQRLAALEGLFNNQTPQRFPGGMTRTSQLSPLDLVMVGSNADGTSKVATVNQIGNIVAAIGSNGYRGPASTDTNPGLPTKPEYWSAKAGVTYPNFKDANGNGVVIPGKVGDDPVLSAALAFNGANWVAEYSATAIDLVDYAKKADISIFPFTSDIVERSWYNNFKGFIVDALFLFEKSPNLYYSFAGINKNDNSVSLTLYSSPNPGGDGWVNMGAFSVSVSNGYNPDSLEPFFITNNLGTIVIIPGAIPTQTVNGLGYLALGFDSTVWVSGDKNHVYIKEAQTKTLINSTAPKFPFWTDVDLIWYNVFKNFLVGAKLTIVKNPNLFYSFAIVQKNETYVSLFLYSSTNKSGGGSIQLGVFSSNLNIGYVPSSMEPLLIDNPALGSVVIVPGALPNTDQSGLFYSLNGLDDSVFESNAKQNDILRYADTQKSILRVPKIDWSVILNFMFYRGKVVMEFIGDSITVGQEGSGTTFPQIFYETVIKAYSQYSAPTSGSPLDFSIINKAIGGTSTVHGREVIQQNTGGANVCHIMYGYNDAPYYGPNFVPVANYKKNLEYIVITAIGQGKVPILGIEPNLTNAFQTGLYTGYRNAIIEIANKYNLIYVDYGKQVWDIITRPDGLHFDNKTYYAMGFDLAGYFTTMNFMNNIEIHKGDTVFVTDAMQNVTGDGVSRTNVNSTKGVSFGLSPGEVLGFSFPVKDNVNVSVKVIDSNDGGVSGKFTVKCYKHLKSPLPEIVPNGTAQTINLFTVKAGNRCFLIENIDPTKDLFIDYISFN